LSGDSYSRTGVTSDMCLKEFVEHCFTLPKAGIKKRLMIALKK
jgi:hypothetical protein